MADSMVVEQRVTRDAERDGQPEESAATFRMAEASDEDDSGRNHEHACGLLPGDCGERREEQSTGAAPREIG